MPLRCRLTMGKSNRTVSASSDPYRTQGVCTPANANAMGKEPVPESGVRCAGAPAPPLGEILLLFMWPFRSPPGPGMTPAGCRGIEFIWGPGGGIEPFELSTVKGDAFGPRLMRPLTFSFKQSGVTGVKGVSEEEDEEDELEERTCFWSMMTSWSAWKNSPTRGQLSIGWNR